MDTCLYPFVQIPRMHIRVTPSVNSEHLVIFVCQRRLIHGHKYAIGGDADNGGKLCIWEEGGYGKSLYLPHNFVVNLELL